MKTLVRMQFGSQVYGTNTPESDTDYKTIVLPEVRDIILQRAFRATGVSTGTDKTKNTKDDVDEDTYSLHYFLKQALDAQTYTLDMLFTPKKFWLEYTPEWEVLVAHRRNLLHRGVASFAGYCQSQAAKYSLKGSNLAAYRLAYEFFEKHPTHMRLEHIQEEIKTNLLDVAVNEAIYHDKGNPIIKLVEIPHKNTGETELYLQVGPKTKVPYKAACGLAAQIYKEQFDKYGARARMAETNQGVDWKALSHAVRVCREAEELLLTQHITFPLVDPVVMQIKKGELPFAQVSELVTEGLERVDAAKAKSSLPDTPDHKFVDDFVFEVYGKHILDELNKEFKNRRIFNDYT